MMKNIALLLVLGSFLPLLFLSSCDTFDPKAEVAAYVKIDSVIFESGFAEGTANQKITDVWFNLDGARVGAFEVPAKFPVIANGKHPVSIRGGIVKSGVHDFREVYPFFDIILDTIDFEGAKITPYVPKFKYKEEAEFWIEDFEDPGINFHTEDTVIEIQQVVDPRDANNTLGFVSFDDTTKSFLMYTKEEIKLYNSPIYMELEYKCEKDFGIGIITRQADGSAESIRPFTLVKPISEWNKMYLNLSEQFALHSGASTYDVYFFVVAEANEPADLYLDNIKIVSYENE